MHVEGLDDVMVRLSRCCTPVPGDEIMGFVTRGRGVSVHRADCANAVSLVDGPERPADRGRVGRGPHRPFVASIEVKALDRSRLLRDVSAALADAHVNIIACNTVTGSDRISKMRFDFELGDPGAPRRADLPDQADRQHLRRLPGAARQGRLTSGPKGHMGIEPFGHARK